MAPLLLPQAAYSQGAQLPPAVELHVPKPPTVAVGDGDAFLVYELHVTNLAAAPLALRRVEVLAPGTDARVLLALADSALGRALTRPGVAPPPALLERARIGGGLRGVTFLWVPVDGRTPPATLRHRLTVAVGDSGAPQTIDGPPVPVTTSAVVVGPPLRGGSWLTANGPAAESGHRRALVPVDGNASIAQRFGIDYLIVDDSGRTYVGDRLKNESYHAHGKDAIAVADGIVAATKDGIPENVPGGRAVPITLETVGGNHVIVDIGGGRHAFYAHLKPGSLRVRQGDRVRRGQVLGLVGNSGNSTEPHLHFHVSDGPSPLGAQGVPYLLDTFQVVGQCRRLIAECTRAATPETRRREMPLANMLLRFPER
ncbi:M23 family metallopeptidase [Roseisolibacter agri]|uniref:Peptidase M23 n=1 Tax=Roseisolibacter agri TaxID=2014610 RepID=A0AA37Q9S0_9BACT|nr:M23 family metallopeptidase [Roseisolibacter agri]GLC24951.1 peptidase M23 [Roseisolibacter agri]